MGHFYFTFFGEFKRKNLEASSVVIHTPAAEFEVT
jgi:hypothetical protein